jgi:NTE family protein
MEAHDRLYVENAEFARTISIPTLGIGTTEFEITDARKEALYQSGRDAAEDFLEAWDFDAYIAEFRQGKERRRRDAVSEQMQRAVRS